MQSREPASVASEASPLSPAAQSIVKAFDDWYEQLGPFDDNWQEQCVGKALEALAGQAGSTKHWHVDQLRALAAELEQSPPSERKP